MLQQSALPSYLQSDRLGPWGIYLQQVDRVAPYLGKLSRWIETLKRPKKSLIVDIPVELDDGTIAHFEGYRIQHNTSRGPGKGGVRFHLDVDQERSRQSAIRRSERRRARQSPYALKKGNRAHHAPLYQRNQRCHRAE